jgi:hypothetical protein
MFSDIFTLIDFLKYQKKIKRVFFFESSFIENHLAPYVDKNKNIDETIIISLYKTQNNNLKKFKIFQVNKLFFLNLFFLLLKTKYCYSSTPDIDHSAFQRSVFKKTKYIYIQHSPVGLIKIFRDNALTNFDVVQVVNTFQKNDLINISKRKNKKIKAWQGKYLFLGDENNEKFSFNINKQERKKILIAPTWGTDFFNLNIHLTIKKNLNPSEYDIFIRPHNMSILNNKNLISDLIQNNFQISKGKINFNQYDLLITDWSGLYIEFAKINRIKSILIETKDKILNDKFYEYKDDSIDTFARNELGKILLTTQLDTIESEVKDIILNRNKHTEKIDKFFDSYFY